jgi:hypothetical protein
VNTPVLGASAASVVRSRSLRLLVARPVLVDRRPLRRAGQRVDQRMLGGQDDVGAAEQRVGSRREHLDHLLGAGHGEADVGADRAADPVALLGQRAGRPVQAVEIVEQPIGVGGDAQHPLLHHPLLDRIAGLDVDAVLDLLVGQDRAERRAEVDRHLGLVGQAPLVELEEDPLGPLVVVGLAGRELAVPVVGQAQARELVLERRDVARGDRARVDVLALGLALGGQAEAVPAHDPQDVVAHHPLGPGDDVGRGVALGVADVEARPDGYGNMSRT